MSEGNILRRPQSGDPFVPSAARERYLLDAAEQVHRWQSHSGGPPQLRTWRYGDIVDVRNTTGGPVEAYTPLGLDGPTFAPSDDLEAFRGAVLFDGIEPAEGQPFVVTLQPLADGEIGRAVASGVVPVQVTGDDQFAELVGDDPAVLTAVAEPTGCEILWRAEGTEAQWALVRLGLSPAESGCDCPNTWHLSAHGAITGGTFALPFTLGTGGGGTTEIFEVPWNASASALQTLLRTHSLVATPSEVVCTLGPLPGREIHITLSGSLAEYTQAFNTPDSTLIEGAAGSQVRIGTFRPVAE